MTYQNGSISQPIDLDDIEKYNTTNNTVVNICTNLRFDYKKLKWTDNEFVEDRNFILKWERRFGGFWYNTENMFPVQPYQPGIS